MFIKEWCDEVSQSLLYMIEWIRSFTDGGYLLNEVLFQFQFIGGGIMRESSFQTGKEVPSLLPFNKY